MHHVSRQPLAALLALLFLTIASAQQGDLKDRPGVVQPPPPAHWMIPEAPVLSPEEALGSFQLASGFRIELVASEPLIHDPVALDFDADGRIWVVEMQSYMPDADGEGELAPTSRIVVLEDTDGDGRMDRSTVYMDGLTLPRSVKVLKDGVLVIEPPYLWWTRDTDGDLKMDEKIAIATNFSHRERGPEGGVNSITWGRDNWLDFASNEAGQWRWLHGQWVNRPSLHRGQWGLSLDDYGRVFTNSNSNYLRVDLYPSHYFQRNRHLGLRAGQNNGIFHQADADQTLWPTRMTPGVNRGYRPDVLREDGTLRAFTAACGPLIYRGDNFPSEFYGNYFAVEPSAHVVRRSLLTEQDGIIQGQNAYEHAEFLGSSDERFRPVYLSTGPDGALYIVDLYRGILQHKLHLTTYLRRQIDQRGLARPIGLGRIYRVVHESKRPGPAPRMTTDSAAQLVSHLSHSNGWWRDTAQRLLVERQDKSVVPALRRLAREGSEVARLHALWSLEGLQAVDEAGLRLALQDASPKIRSAAIRLAEPWLAAASSPWVEEVLRAAQEAGPEVRVQAALSLGESPEPVRSARLGELLTRFPDQPFLVTAVLTGLSGRELEFLEQKVLGGAWTGSPADRSALLEDLTAAVLRQRDAQRTERLWTVFDRSDLRERDLLAILTGAEKSRVRPLVLAPAAYAKLVSQNSPRIKELTETLFGAPAKAPLAPLSPEHQQLWAEGEAQYQLVCAACHQASGDGLTGVAKSLVGSSWVEGSATLLAKLVLKGKEGQNEQGGVWVMPPAEILSDRNLAAILTYIRRSWGNLAEPVEADVVARARQECVDRDTPWSTQELEQLKASMAPR